MDRCEKAYEKFDELEKKRENIDLDDFEEFMRNVEEVSKMVHALASDVNVEEATKSADKWLANHKREKRADKEVIEEIINDPSQCVKNKSINRSSINRKEGGDRKSKARENLDNLSSDSMSQEDFMKSVEEDAKKRSEDRKKRIAESDAIKEKANKAFREGDLEKALDLYNKAIDVRKDSCVLYTNRALTLLKLELYSRAIKDCETALKLNENSFKARLYKWHAYYEMSDDENANAAMEDLLTEFPEKLMEIKDYEKKVRVEDEDSDGT